MCYLPVHSDGSIGSEHHFLYQLLWGAHQRLSPLDYWLSHYFFPLLFAHLLKDSLILMSVPFNASVSSQSGQEGSPVSQGDFNEFNFSGGNTTTVTVLYCCYCSCWEVYFISKWVWACPEEQTDLSWFVLPKVWQSWYFLVPKWTTSSGPAKMNRLDNYFLLIFAI